MWRKPRLNPTVWSVCAADPPVAVAVESEVAGVADSVKADGDRAATAVTAAVDTVREDMAVATMDMEDMTIMVGVGTEVMATTTVDTVILLLIIIITDIDNKIGSFVDYCWDFFAFFAFFLELFFF